MKPTRDAVLQLAWSVLADLDLELVLERALDAAKTLTGARYAALGVLDEDGQELARFLTDGIDAETAREIGPHPRGRGVLGELIRQPEPLRLDDVETHPHAYGYPPAHPPMHTFLGVPIRVGSRVYGNLYLTEKEGGRPFDDEDEAAVVQIAEFTGLAIDHARRYEGSVVRERSARRTANALEATVTIARTLAGQSDLDVILDLIAKRGRALASARAVFIELVEGDGLRIAAVAGEIHPELKGVRVDQGRSLAASALESRQTERVDAGASPDLTVEYGDGRLGFTFEDALAVPLVLRGRVYGALVALDRQIEGPRFSELDEELLEGFSASATIALATAHLVDDQRRRARLAAAESERGRWARELHDDTLQGLVNLRHMLVEIAGTDPAEIAHRSAVAAEEVEAEITKLRSLITELRPLDLDRQGTAPALEALVGGIAERGTEIEMTIDLAYEAGRHPSRHTDELETAIFRIVQESLQNATKHAAGARIEIEVVDQREPGLVLVRIADDGPGFEPEASHPGFGLQSIRERVDLLGGHLLIRSGRGDGTEIVARLPDTRRRTPTPQAAGETEAGSRQQVLADPTP
ncbi:MAG TPA: GAF domain-containing protein [Solirubrobacterales bacterium]|nr:GAF domain-containing protein [Solirubrobacterales bacterium]